MPFIGEDKKPPHKPKPPKNSESTGWFEDRSQVPKWEIERKLDRDSKTRYELAKELGLSTQSPNYKAQVKKIKEKLAEAGSVITEGEVKKMVRKMAWDEKHELAEKSEGGLSPKENVSLGFGRKINKFLKEKFENK